MQNRYLNEIITLDSENDIEHHGVVGMKWGIRRYQPYSLIPRKSGKNGKLVGDAKKKAKSSSKTSVSKKAASKKVADVKKSRNQKSAEAKAAVEKQEKTARQRRESLDKIIKSGDAKSIYERRSEMSQKQLQDAVNRLNTEKQLRAIVAEQNPSKMKARIQKLSDIMDTVNKVNTAVNTGVNTYKTIKSIKKLATEPGKENKKKELEDLISDSTKISEISERRKELTPKQLQSVNDRIREEKKLDKYINALEEEKKHK